MITDKKCLYLYESSVLLVYSWVKFYIGVLENCNMELSKFQRYLLGLVFIVVFFVFVFQPIQFGYVIGDSMEPTMSGGDVFVYTDIVEPDTGDVIIYKQDSSIPNQKYIIHRVISVKEDSYITKGDNNVAADKPVQKDQYKGTVLIHMNQDLYKPSED
jgi:signal peptidase